MQIKEKLLSTDVDFWRTAARTSKILKVVNELTREEVGVTRTVTERVENNVLKLYGQILRMEDNR